MQGETNEVIIVIVAGTFLMLLLAAFIAVFAFLFQRRQFQYKQEKQALTEASERTLLQAQIETQNQTLHYVGQELHDHIGQLLSVAMLHLNGLDEELDQTDQRHAIKQTLHVVSTAIQDVRALSKTLDSDTIRRFGLRASLQAELERIERTGRYQTYLHVVGTPYALGEQPEIILFRMAQEALNNAIKHAGGQTLMVTADYAPGRFSLTITNDGQGFDVAEASTRDLTTSGSGLRNLRQRAELLGGTCTITSLPDEGTRVLISLPTTVA